MSSPVDAALAVGSRKDLVVYLADLAQKARQGEAPVENLSTPDFIEASGAWLEGLDSFLRRNAGRGEEEVSTWAIVAMIYSGGLVYE
ncbi:DUF7660 family protein [Myceligenerans halotolerans]